MAWIEQALLEESLMVKRTLTTIALSSCLVIGLESTSSANDRQELREAAGVEAGDRVDRRREVREAID